jgi:hypothetical protein
VKAEQRSTLTRIQPRWLTGEMRESGQGTWIPSWKKEREKEMTRPPKAEAAHKTA